MQLCNEPGINIADCVTCAHACALVQSSARPSVRSLTSAIARSRSHTCLLDRSQTTQWVIFSLFDNNKIKTNEDDEEYDDGDDDSSKWSRDDRPWVKCWIRCFNGFDLIWFSFHFCTAVTYFSVDVCVRCVNCIFTGVLYRRFSISMYRFLFLRVFSRLIERRPQIFYSQVEYVIFIPLKINWT